MSVGFVGRRERQGKKETPKDRSYVQSEACRCPSFVRRSARLSVPQSKPCSGTSDGYERTPVFLGSTCFVLRPCGTARPTDRPRASFFFRRTGERDRNPYFLSATSPSPSYLVYGIIDNVCIDAWSSSKAAGLDPELQERRLYCGKSYYSNAFSLSAIMVLNGMSSYGSSRPCELSWW